MQFSESTINRILKKTPKLYSSKQVLADEVWRYCGKELPFSRIMSFINKLGEKAIWEILAEIKQSPSTTNKIAGFIWKCNENMKQIEWK